MFGFANAATGAFSSYSQISKFLEGKFIYNQNDFYVQDNWKVNRKLTLDYGVRFVNQQPYYDARKQASNFLPETWASSSAPLLYVAGCANGVSPCAGANRQAMNPVTGQFLGTNSSIAIGTLVPGSGSPINGLAVQGERIVDTGYKWPTLGAAPRFGMAYDVTGNQHLLIRGGAGLYYDRPSANAAGTYNMIGNPPVTNTATVRYGQLQTLGNGGLSTLRAPALQANGYNSPLPASAQFNIGIQAALPWATTVDVSYVGQHSYDTIQTVNLNSIDIGAAFLASSQDPTAAPSATPGASSLAATNPDLVRSYRGYSAITQRFYNGWRTYHSLQLSLNRRFRNGFSFGFNDTIGLSDKGSIAPRLDHGAAGTYSIRSDQADAQALLGDNAPQAHVLKANVVWDLPDLKASRSIVRALALRRSDSRFEGVRASGDRRRLTLRTHRLILRPEKMMGERKQGTPRSGSSGKKVTSHGPRRARPATSLGRAC
ncbi:MAG: hypothetical protein ABI818_05820 [Acidobacteriota bacterium]